MIEFISKNIFKKLYSRKYEVPIHFYYPAKRHVKTTAKSLGKRPQLNDQNVLTSDKENKLAAAFSKPPMPPLFGPFFILSILEMAIRTDKKKE